LAFLAKQRKECAKEGRLTSLGQMASCPSAEHIECACGGMGVVVPSIHAAWAQRKHSQRGNGPDSMGCHHPVLQSTSTRRQARYPSIRHRGAHGTALGLQKDCRKNVTHGVGKDLGQRLPGGVWLGGSQCSSSRWQQSSGRERAERGTGGVTH